MEIDTKAPVQEGLVQVLLKMSNNVEMVFIPSATTAGGHADHLWELKQRAHAVANGIPIDRIAVDNRPISHVRTNPPPIV